MKKNWKYLCSAYYLKNNISNDVVFNLCFTQKLFLSKSENLNFHN